MSDPDGRGPLRAGQPPGAREHGRGASRPRPANRRHGRRGQGLPAVPNQVAAPMIHVFRHDLRPAKHSRKYPACRCLRTPPATATPSAATSPPQPSTAPASSPRSATPSPATHGCRQYPPRHEARRDGHTTPKRQSQASGTECLRTFGPPSKACLGRGLPVKCDRTARADSRACRGVFLTRCGSSLIRGAGDGSSRGWPG